MRGTGGESRAGAGCLHRVCLSRASHGCPAHVRCPAVLGASGRRPDSCPRPEAGAAGLWPALGVWANGFWVGKGKGLALFLSLP